MRPTTRLGVAGVLVLAGATLTACGEPDPEDTGVGDALERLPAVPDGEFVTVRYTNLAKVREVADVGVPDLDDDESVSRFVEATSGYDDADVLVLPTRYDQVSTPSQMVEEVGFTWLQADVVADVQAGDTNLAWYGFADDVELAERLQEQDDEGVYADEDGGRPVVAVDGERAAVTDDETLAARWLENDGDSLADDERFGDLADTLDDADAITALLTTVGEDYTIGIGLSADDGDAGFVVAYRLGSDDDADAAVDGLTDAYSEVDGLDVDDVGTDGQRVVVTGTADPASAPIELFTRFNLPLPE